MSYFSLKKQRELTVKSAKFVDSLVVNCVMDVNIEILNIKLNLYMKIAINFSLEVSI